MTGMAPFIRIFIRVLCGYMAGQDWIDAGMAEMLASDPDVVDIVTQTVAFATWGVTEAWYLAARRFGWAK